MSLALAMATTALSAGLSGGTLTFDCDLWRPGGTRIDVHGTFDGEELRTNIADRLRRPAASQLAGGLRISVENLVHHYEWNGPPDRIRLNVQMVEYGHQHAAVLTIVDRYSDGRHSVDSLIGTGMCETRRGGDGQ